MSLTVYLTEMRPLDIYEGNITHNLAEMAKAAGIYEVLWRPEELGMGTARELIRPLRAGLAALRADPAHFRLLEPSNGWGSYESLVEFVTDYLAACEIHPNATLEVSR